MPRSLYGVIIPDSEEEDSEEEENLRPQQGQQQRLISETQAAAEDLLAACGSPAACGGAAAVAVAPRLPAWLSDVALRAPSVTLVLPRDARGVLGHDTRCLVLPGRQATAEALLRLIHGHYQVRLGAPLGSQGARWAGRAAPARAVDRQAAAQAAAWKTRKPQAANSKQRA